ncbi:MAG: nucleotidyltransferase domain-containing protein, partial [Nitrososphaeria archaeon]
MNLDLKADYEGVKKVIEIIKTEVTPTHEQRNKLKEAEKVISERLKAKGLKFVLGGSYARDTWLPEDADIDF